MDKHRKDLPLELETIIQRWINWYRLRRALSLALPGLLFGLAAALGFTLANLGQSMLVLSEYIILTVASGLAGMSVFAAIGFLWRSTAENTTRFFDRYFRLFERTSTALELSWSGDPGSSANPLVKKQYQDALQNALQVEPGPQFFIKLPRQQINLLAVLITAIVVVAILSRPFFEQAQTRQAIQEAIKQEVAALETLKEQIKGMENLTPQQRLDITKELDKAIAELQNAKSLEQAVAAMQEAESNLQSLDPARIQQQSSDLRQAGQELLNQAEGSQNTPLNDFANELAAGDLAQAAETLDNLDLQSMSEQDQATLADQLEQTANAVAQSNPELAKQLGSAAKSLQQGDASAAEAALSEASQSLDSTASQAAQAGAARQAAEQIENGSGRLVQAGQSAQTNSSQTGEAKGGGANSSSESQGSGQSDGSGSSTTGENSGVGSGSGSGSSPGNDTQGGEAGTDPIDQANGPGDGGESLFEEVFSPQRLGGGAGESVTLPPSTTMDEILGLSGSDPGQTSSSTVPYQSISPSLVDAYRKFSSSGEIPNALRDYIKYYYYNLAQP
jgi:hypothetical protein